MANDAISDHYDTWYAEKLWRLLPAIYRTEDTSSTPGSVGPLRELVNRIGVQMAVLRRSVDRLWENQSIETSDDWAIPYIGDLLATRIIAFLDARAQRLDVANTISYRRREGTVALLEQLAADIAGRDARVVEFFRRLGRTRHQFDPAIGIVSKPDNATQNPLVSMVEGLVGTYSLTGAGGYADLRNTYAAANANNTPFDEFAHTADLRRGAQSNGWYNISHLGVFIWWLHSFGILLATPCESVACPGHFTFDPTGRDIPLFARASRTSPQSFGENWVAPNEWQLPVAIREVLWDTVPEQLYPDALSVHFGGGDSPPLVSLTDLAIFPERGRFNFVAARPLGTFTASYHFGFLSELGAGGFDERVLGSSVARPDPTVAVSGGTGLDAAIAAVGGSTTIEIGDSMTYPGPASTLTVHASSTVVLRAANQRRPVVRWPGTAKSTFTIHGQGAGTTAATTLIVQGILFQGADIVLTGEFDEVRLRLVTLDPGTSANPSSGSFFGSAIDGTPLRPVTVYVEAKIGKLILERSITGPVRSRNGGSVELLTATDCILQSIPTHPVGSTPSSEPIFDPADLAAHWKSGGDPAALGIGPALPASTVAALAAYTLGTPPSAALVAELESALLLQDRAQMEAAYPRALADLAIGLSSGSVSLARCSMLGRTATHRMLASETIFDEVAIVEDPQHGCVRFSAYAENSNLHQPFRSVVVASLGPVFVSRKFGEPEYARLRRDADRAILAPNSGDTIVGGAENGSEMGAFAGERIALKKRGLALKFLEFMPLGISPVWIDAD